MMKVKPKDGLKVKKPDGSLLKNTGEEIDEKSIYWIRRLKEGDVVKCETTTRGKQ